MTKEQFLKDINPWGSHRALLWTALESTKDSPFPVVELGCGDNSTPFLRQYCSDAKRNFVSYESNHEWAQKMGSTWLTDWHPFLWFYKKQYSVVLIDEAPGEHRKEAIQLFASYRVHFAVHFEILIVHDSEPPGWNASDYQVRPLFSKFKYVKDDVPKEKGSPWTSALSNTIDVTKWDT